MSNFIKTWWERILKIPPVRFVYEVFSSFGSNNGGFYAAGLSFFLILSFAPIILTCVAILGCFIDVHSASVKVIEMVQNVLPSGGARDEATSFMTNQLKIEQQVQSIVDHRGVAGIIGFVTLVWTTLQIFINASVAMNAIWDVHETRNWFAVRGSALILMVGTGALTVLSLVLSGAPAAIEAFRLPIINHLPAPLGVLTVVSEFAAVLLNTVIYVAMYKVLPNADVSWIAAVTGGLTAGVLTEAAKIGMADHLLKANHSFYGGLASLVLFVLWIYYSMTILLLGAEVAAAISRRREERQPTTNNVIRKRTREERIKTASHVGR